MYYNLLTTRPLILGLATEKWIHKHEEDNFVTEKGNIIISSMKVLKYILAKIKEPLTGFVFFSYWGMKKKVY